MNGLSITIPKDRIRESMAKLLWRLSRQHMADEKQLDKKMVVQHRKSYNRNCDKIDCLSDGVLTTTSNRVGRWSDRVPRSD